MEKRPAQSSLYLAVSCLILAICVFLVVGGMLLRNWNQASLPNGVKLDRDELSSLEPRRYTLQELNVPLGDCFPAPLDAGRVKVAAPTQWRPRPRSSKYVARFVLDATRRAPLPMITVTADAAKFDEPQTASEENLTEFLELMFDSLTEDERRRVLESPKPIVLGDVACVRYVLRSKPTRFKQLPAPKIYEQQILKTLHKGRVYTVTLDVFESTLEQFRNTGYAVMAGLQFVEPLEDAGSTEDAGLRKTRGSRKTPNRPRKIRRPGRDLSRPLRNNFRISAGSLGV